MSGSDKAPVVRHSGDSLPQEGVRPEEDPQWVIRVYNRHCLREVSQELDGDLGPGRGPDRYMPPVLLDNNPVSHRQSLQEQIFPNPRAIQEDLVELNKTKLLLEAPAGMGKTTFLKIYQEARLQTPDLREYPMTVYLDLGLLPQGTGFSEFYPLFFRHATEVILREAEEQPELEIRKDRLQRTLERLVLTGQIMFLLDGLDRLAPEDRFQFFHDVVVDGDALRDNWVLLAMRPVGFGPMATSSVIKRGQDACFRLGFQKLDESTRKAYLGEIGNLPAIDTLRLYFPELFETPYLLRLLKAIAENGLLERVHSRTRFYETWLSQVLQEGPEEGDARPASSMLRRLEEISWNLAVEGRFQRFEEAETGYPIHLLEGEPPLIDRGALHWTLDPLLKQTQNRWEYRHPGLQEYFAGRKLARETGWAHWLERYGRDSRWQEVFYYFTGAYEGAVDAVFDRMLETGAVFLAGNASIETRGLSQAHRLLVGHLLKYQDRERYPQFSRNRLVQVEQVVEAVGRERLREVAACLLDRRYRDPRILYPVLELLCALHGIDFQGVMDSQQFGALQALPELQEFLSERDDPRCVDGEIMRRWGERVTVSEGKFVYQDETDEEDQIRLREFSIMRYPVTNALWRQFDPAFELRYPRYSFEDDHPVIGINFYEATVFALWMGLRLPTEKEWEKAARGTDGRLYPWGEALGYQTGYTNTADFVLGRTNAVGDYEEGASPYGCYDMAGNVWEWCVQLHSSRFSTQKIVRGGSWLNYLVHAKCVFRNSFDPAEHHPAVGFRCVSQPLTEEEED